MISTKKHQGIALCAFLFLQLSGLIAHAEGLEDELRVEQSSSDQDQDLFNAPPEIVAGTPVDKEPLSRDQRVESIYGKIINEFDDESIRTLRRTPAAVFVITEEMIRRSGARTLPDALRMVPGMYVSQIDSSKWNVSSRGFSSRFARKLLIQIDGRTVYTPLFGGTFWDVQDVLLKDVERIEVIRGPGATIWGENAVNGVVNVITKSSADTHGTYVEAGGGTEQRGFTNARVGGVSENGVNYRLYGKWFERDRQFEPDGNAFDDWRQGRIGFRSDWENDLSDRFTLQGDTYFGSNGTANMQPLIGLEVDDEPVSGANLLGRWTHQFDDDSDSTFQIYYDRNDRNTLGFDQNLNTFDVDWQYRRALNERHKLVTGMGYRRVWDRIENDRVPAILNADPSQRTTEIFSAFIQDEIMLKQDELYLTVGTKIGDNTFTDFEIQPGVRLLWLPDESSSAWASVSRAVRLPSRLERDGQMVISDVGGVIPVVLNGSSSITAEEMIAYEVGYRDQPTEWFTFDLAMFYNVDQGLANFRVDGAPTNLQFFNGGNSDSYGLELAGQVEMNDKWRIFSWYSFIRTIGEVSPQAVVPALDVETGVPRHQVFMMSSWDLRDDLQFDLISRYVDNVSALNIPSYISMDCRVAYRPKEHMEISLVGQNLLDPHHPEYGSSLFVHEVPTEVQRGVYGMVAWEY